jgi:ABC-2 type transport system ATP-binding protein
VAVDTLEHLRNVAVQRLEVEFRGTPPPADALRHLPGVQGVEADDQHLVVSFEGAADPIVKTIAGYDVQSIRSREADLEEVFLHFYRDDASP